MTFDFDPILESIDSANTDLRWCINRLRDEAEEIQTNYDELLEYLGATDHNSALDAIRAMKAASIQQVVVGPVFREPAIKLSDSTALTPEELATIITQRLSKAIDEFKATTPAVKKVRTFGDIAGVN